MRKVLLLLLPVMAFVVTTTSQAGGTHEARLRWVVSAFGLELAEMADEVTVQNSEFVISTSITPTGLLSLLRVKPIRIKSRGRLNPGRLPEVYFFEYERKNQTAIARFNAHTSMVDINANDVEEEEHFVTMRPVISHQSLLYHAHLVEGTPVQIMGSRMARSKPKPFFVAKSENHSQPVHVGSHSTRAVPYYRQDDGREVVMFIDPELEHLPVHMQLITNKITIDFNLQALDYRIDGEALHSW